MIGSWWRGRKHQWLDLNELDSAATVVKCVAFYVEQYNTVFPHSAFEGQRPDEVYLETGDAVPSRLENSRTTEAISRLDSDRAKSFQACDEVVKAER